MQILPPRRPGQFGAIPAGAGVQGPSGGFSIQSSGSARSSAPPPGRPVQQKGSVAPLPAPSVSEQVAMRQNTSAKAAAATVPQFSQGGTYSTKQAVVGVQAYKPPPGTPAVTAPPKQPNESAAVKLLANQVPQTKAQQVQKVLARDAGIAVPLPPGQPPNVIPRQAPLPKYPPPPQPRPVTNPVVSPSISPPRPAPSVPASSGGAFNVNATTASNIPNRQPGAVAPVITPAVMKTAVAATSAVVGAKIAEQKAAMAMRAAANSAAVTAKLEAEKQAAIERAKTQVAEATQKFSELQAKNQKAANVLSSQTASDDAKAKAEAELRDARDAAALAAKLAAEADAAAKQLAVEQRKAEQEQKRAESVAEVAREAAKEKKTEALEKQADAIDTQRKIDSQGDIQTASFEELLSVLAAAEAGTGFKTASAQQVAAVVPAIRAEMDRRARDFVERLRTFSEDDLSRLVRAAENGESFAGASPAQVAFALPYVKAEIMRRMSGTPGRPPPPSPTPTSSASGEIDSQGPLVQGKQFITMGPSVTGAAASSSGATAPASGAAAEEDKGISATTILLGLVAVGALVYASGSKKGSLNEAPLVADLDEE